MCFCWTFYLSVFTCKCTLFNFSMKEKTHFILIDVVHFPACKLCISLTIFMSLLCLPSLPHSASYTRQHLWQMLIGSAFSVGGFTQSIPMHQFCSKSKNSPVCLFARVQSASRMSLTGISGGEKKEVLSWYSC